MKKFVTVVVILLVVAAGVVLGVMQPWKKGGDAKKSEGDSTAQELASAKGINGKGVSKETKVPKNPPATIQSKPKTRAIPIRRVPTRSVPTKKTEEHADKNSTESAHANPKLKVLVGKHDLPAKKTEKHADKNSTEPAHANPKPNVLVGGKNLPSDPEEALVGSWMTSHDGFEFTIILKKGGKGEMHIAEGDRKATPHMITWKADSKKLTLVNKDLKTHDEDVTEGVYNLSNENGIKSLRLEYELEKQEFTFINF